MVVPRLLKVGLPSSITEMNFENYFTDRRNIYSQIFLVMLQAMNFSYEVTFYSEAGRILPNGTWTGAIAMLNRSEIDIVPRQFLMSEQRITGVSFTYPIFLYEITFMTHKPEYFPKTFAIFHIFSRSVWIALATSATAMVILYVILLQQNRKLDKILLHVLAILLKQPPILTLRNTCDYVLILSWILGSMFLSLCYESLLLSFLSFPSLSGIKDVQELANAVQNNDYNCMMVPGSVFPKFISNLTENKLKIIGKNLQENNYRFGDLKRFMDLSNKKLAYIEARHNIEYLHGKYFVSKDFFLQTMIAMPVRKDFCCKEDLDKIIHRKMCSGLYQKFASDSSFKIALERLYSNVTETVNPWPLNLKDLSPAFMLLIAGHCVAFLSLVVERLFYTQEAFRCRYFRSRRRRNKIFHKTIKRRRKINTSIL